MNETEPPEEPNRPQESADPQKLPESDAGFKKWERALAIISFGVGIAALIAALIALSFRSLVLWLVLIGVCAIAFLPLITALRRSKYITFAYALLCAVLVFALYGEIASQSTAPVGAKSASTTSVARSSIEIDYPLPGSSVPTCINVSGTAKLASGDVIWIMIQGLGPKVYYLEGKAETSPSQNDPGHVEWAYPAYIGTLDLAAEYQIFAVVVNSSTSDFMAGLENVLPPGKKTTQTPLYAPDIDTQADRNLPPGTDASAVRSVKRTPNVEGDCG